MPSLRSLIWAVFAHRSVLFVPPFVDSIAAVPLVGDSLVPRFIANIVSLLHGSVILLAVRARVGPMLLILRGLHRVSSTRNRFDPLLQVLVLLLLKLLLYLLVLLVVLHLDLLVLLPLLLEQLLELFLLLLQLAKAACLKLSDDRLRKVFLRELLLILLRADRRSLLDLGQLGAASAAARTRPSTSRTLLITRGSADATCADAAAAVAADFVRVVLVVLVLLVVEARVGRQLHLELVHVGPARPDDAQVTLLMVNVEQVVLVLLEVRGAAAAELVRQVEIQGRMVLQLLVLQVMLVELSVLAQLQLELVVVLADLLLVDLE